MQWRTYNFGVGVARKPGIYIGGGLSIKKIYSKAAFGGGVGNPNQRAGRASIHKLPSLFSQILEPMLGVY